MADRDGAVAAAGPPHTTVADEPAPGVTSTEHPQSGAPLVQGPRKAEGGSFFDEPVRTPELGAAPDRVTLDASPAEVVAGAQAETTELRAALDDLRRVLDDVDAAGVSPRRRRLPVVALTGGLAAVVVAGLALNGTLGGRDETTGAVSSPSTPDGSAPTGSAPVGSAPAPAVSPSAPPVGTTPQLSVTPPAALPADGPGVTEPGTTAVATIDPVTGHVRVYEQFVATSAADSLPLTLTRPTALQDTAEQVTPQVQDLSVTLDGRPTRAVPAGDDSWVASPPNAGRFSRAVLNYTVTGAFAASQPASKGRGLIFLSPLSGGRSQSLPVRLVTTSPAVISINCPTAPATAVVCEQPAEGRKHTAVLPGGTPDALMMLAVDLPQVS
jgi:hypothetical protein